MTTTLHHASEILKDVPAELIHQGQVTAICSLFVVNDLISATTEKLARLLFVKFDEIIPLEQIVDTVTNAIPLGIRMGLIDTINNDYTLTEGGWTVGHNWNNLLTNEI